MDVISKEQASEEEKERKAILVILVGAPGSGKSTFCDNVIRISSCPWLRVCQDTIGNGKAGTKIQCLTSAASGLKDGKNVFIDRCNLDREQRADFVKLGGSHVDVHAVVLDLPAKVCISRSVKRTGHEGNLQGGRAAAVVNRMLQKKELPKLSEGFSRITFCQNETDVEAAVNTYVALGPLETLPSGCFGQKNHDAKVQLGIMKFLKKVDVPSDAGSGANISQASAADQLHKGKDPASEGPEKDFSSSSHAGKELKVLEDVDMGSIDGTVSLDAVPTLAFPSISTADFQFNLEKASDIIVEQVEVFLKKHGNARLVLVDLSHKSKILSLVRSKASQRNIDSSKFLTFVGDITRLFSQGGLRCNIIANAANWRLRPGGGGVNAAIYNAAGQALDMATKERAGSLIPGKALVVPLPSTSPLFSREGVTHVIHVLGPNMNPQRPDCLDNNYMKGCKVLREAYSSLFEGFASILKIQEKLIKESSENLRLDSKNHFEVGKFSNGDQKFKREGVYESERNKKCKGSQDEVESNITNSMDGNEVQVNEKIGGSMTKAWGPWAQALHIIAMHPEHKNYVIEIFDDVVVLNDHYPKAQKHMLVLARAAGLDHLADVHKEHIQLLKKMHDVAVKWAGKCSTENKSLAFRLGYHMEPSMRQLHLHVISQDFDSKHLKNKKHWNSFNSPFFRDSVDVIEEVIKHGKATLKDGDSFLSMELRCHRCRSAHPNIPRLKSHISNCQAPFPAALLQNGRLVLPPSKEGAN